ncbi:tetratricopeptide repeat protein [Hasllibacter sp. MH4015]|uniref:tetratricopeptide repeat protein n=1 Tax=Hasllibacter sp. MH4015 TaxID=2854029 RepID=UPI001CD209E8|nr:hypothetical protein [Hasllibacter sp. MH4015]
MTRSPSFLLAAGLAFGLAMPLAAQSFNEALDAYDAGNLSLAGQIVQPLAEAGDARAMNLFANILDDGAEGFPRDPALAFDYYTRAAAGGSSAAQNNLGRVYHLGRLGQAVDAERAEQLYLQAIAGGSQFAQNNYALMQEEGLLGPQDWPAIVSLYQAAADRNEPNAAANLANLYLNGGPGFQTDPVIARQWGERAVLVENTRGMRILGYMLELGIGGDHDVARAVELYQTAYNMGDASAANDLGLLLEYGAPGVEPSNPQAAAWYEVAIQGGSVGGHMNMAGLLNDGDPDVPDDGARARALYEYAHAEGNLRGTVNLSYLYWDGVGGPVDFGRARELLTDASNRGDLGAMNDLAVMNERGLGAPVNVPAAADLYLRAAQGGHTLGAQNLAYILTDASNQPVNPVEGLAWCHFASEREDDAETQAEYRQNCADIGVNMSDADRSAAVARSAQLLQQF